MTVDPHGELGGIQQFLTGDLLEWQGALDDFATDLIAQVNAVNQNGVTADGSQGPPLLGGTDALDLALLTDDVADLAAAPDDFGGDPPPLHADGNARLFADLRFEAFPDPDEPTLGARIDDLVVGLAGRVSAASQAAEAAAGVATGAALARTAEHSVSLDEEMVGLVRYQRALEASSRVMTTVDEMLEVLVNRTGIVGR